MFVHEATTSSTADDACLPSGDILYPCPVFFFCPVFPPRLILYFTQIKYT